MMFHYFFKKIRYHFKHVINETTRFAHIFQQTIHYFRFESL